MKTKLKKHWYKIFTDECVMCGSNSTWRERQFTPKPKMASTRHIFKQEYCGCLGF